MQEDATEAAHDLERDMKRQRQRQADKKFRTPWLTSSSVSSKHFT